jgi:hypothetical protein
MGVKPETFFCSSLIAKTFKECKIMQNVDTASHRFLPADFSQQAGENLPFLEYVHAHPEKTLLIGEHDEKSTIKSESEV